MLLLLLIAALTQSGCGKKAPHTPAPSASANPDALQHASLFKKGVETVTDGVHVAIGYSLANSILIEGNNGVIIVDTLESRRRAETVFAAFREITTKPVKALILTHNHADHVFGGAVFTGGDSSIPVYAHATTSALIDQLVSTINDAIYTRSMRMFGQFLDSAATPHAGIGPGLDYDSSQMALQRPTHTFTDRLSVEIDGIQVELLHLPGETPDQIGVWLPEKRVLLPADNVYQAFPNLYTIRGTSYRDVNEWIDSIDQMRALGAEFLVPSHTRPIYGREAVAEVLTAYRDAIQFVHDQTVRGMNKGQNVATLAATLRLPPHLENHPWLQPYYGTVPWSVKGIYDGYLGWFDGNAASLEPLPPKVRAERWASALLLGKGLEEQVADALESGDHAWAAELADKWVTLEPENPDARSALAAAFEAHAKEHPSANGRNYFLSQAAELRGELQIPPLDKSKIADDFLDSLPIARFMRALPVRLKAEETLALHRSATFHFLDTDEHYTLEIRRGIAEVRNQPDADADLKVATTTQNWKRLATGKKSAAAALLTGDLQVEGGVLALREFMDYFER